MLGFYNGTGVVDPSNPAIIHYSNHVDLVTPNHFTHFHAEVDAVRNAVVLSHDKAALALKCLENRIFVKFGSDEAARWFAGNITVGTVVPLEEEWNCAFTCPLCCKAGIFFSIPPPSLRRAYNE